MDVMAMLRHLVTIGGIGYIITVVLWAGAMGVARAGSKTRSALLHNARLSNCHLAHAAQADLLRRLARVGEARAAYQRALELAQQEPEQRLLAMQLAALG